MIVGGVSAFRTAIISVTVIGTGGVSQTFDAVVDTGFTDYLTLPLKAIDALGLEYIGTSQATLANWQIETFNVYRAQVLWESEEKAIQVFEAEVGPLVGMSLLYGCLLTVYVVDGGNVTIELMG